MRPKYIPLVQTPQGLVPARGAGAGKGKGFKPLPTPAARAIRLGGTAPLGLLTGTPSGVVVVDLDPRSLPDNDLDAEIVRLGLHEVQTMVVATPRDGKHFYFTADDDVLAMTSRPNAFGPGADFKGDRGYVVAAGSERHDKVRGVYTLISDVEPAPLPEHLATQLREYQAARLERRQQAVAARENAPAKQLPAPACCGAVARDKVGAVLQAMDELAELAEGETADLNDVLPFTEELGWDGAYWRLAAKLIEVAEWPYTKYTIERAHRDFLEHAPDADGTYDPDRKWDNGYSNAGTFYEGETHRLEYHGGGATVMEKPAGTGAVLAAESPAEPEVGGWSPLDLQALLDPHRPPREWFLADVAPKGDQISIVAPGGTGKSLFALALSISACRGDSSFIGKPVSFSGKVLYIDMENSEDDWAERLRDLGVTQASAVELAKQFVPLSLPQLRGLDTALGAAQLTTILDQFEIGAGDVLVLDSTQRVTEGDENENDTIRNLYNFTSAELKRRGITVIRTDNTGKDLERGARGASAKRDDVGYSWILERENSEADIFRLTNDKRRSAGDSGVIRYQLQTIDGVLRFMPVIESVEEIEDDSTKRAKFQKAVIEILRNDYEGAALEGTDPGITENKLLTLVKQDGAGVQRERGRTWLGQMVQFKEIDTRGGTFDLKQDGSESKVKSTKYYTYRVPPVFEDDGSAY